eukprot:TRINITY_DN3145_c0_g1_i1.p1 TRINITY_DN3145_c0_g1~~TRINITY_DN3145_c0_g1_i1.p1  ORF type:complete len:282 (+),score=52.38 TRINITY_DN3145_c0_g1_i1:552-1397(+)
MNDYTALEHYFMLVCVAEILSPSDGKSSSIRTLVDECFYVLRESTSRTLATYNINSTLAFVNNLDEVINGDIRHSLYFHSNITLVEHVKTTLIGLNNLEISAEYLTSLIQEISSATSQTFKSQTSSLAKIAAVVESLTDTQRQFREQVALSLEIYFKSSLSRLHSILATDPHYHISQETYTNYEINDPWVRSTITGLTKFLRPSKSMMREQIFSKFIRLTLNYVFTFLEKLLRMTKFTLYGAKQFESEFMALMSFFASPAPHSLRDRFERLRQVNELINVE